MKFTELSIDQYESISQWYHFAILSLTELKDYKHCSEWIAKRLNITKNTAKDAIERLERLGFLVWENHTIKVSSPQYHTTDEINSYALRAAHKNNLELAKKSLQNDDISHRDFCSMTMAIDIKKIPQAKKMIRDFRNKLCSYLESEEQNEVFKICFQLFPLTKINNPGEL